MNKALIGHKKLHAGVTSTGISFILVREESIHEEMLVDPLVLEHPFHLSRNSEIKLDHSTDVEVVRYVQHFLRSSCVNSPHFAQIIGGDTSGL